MGKKIALKNSFFLMGIYFLSYNSFIYCPVKTTPFDSMWKFLSATLELPSDWGNWTFSQRKQWEDFYREDPTPLLTEEQNEAYILVLRKIYLELDKSSYKTNEEWQDYWDEICRRLTMAGDDFYS